MSENAQSERGFGKLLAGLCVSVAAIAVVLTFFGGVIRRYVLESRMQRVASGHYEILCPAGTFSRDAITQFAAQRESVFAGMDKRLGDAGSNSKIRIVFDLSFAEPRNAVRSEQPYSVSGTTIRTKLNSQSLGLPFTADAEALLDIAWGKPGNAKIARWTAIWLTGEWRGSEIGMAAAGVEQRLGHKKLETVLSGPSGEIPTLDDEDLLGAAWLSEIADFRGGDAVHKVYAAKMSRPNVAEVAKVLDTTSPELERRWQMWIYAYLAGMPSMQQGSAMPMNMPMGGSQ